MRLFRKRRQPIASAHVTRIRRGVLETIADAAQDTYPLEFAGALKARGDTVVEVILIPGTISGDSHAILRTYHLPADFSIVGSVHSHPSPSARPSDADLQLFKNFGRLHMIMAYPYNLRSWRAYDSNGRRVALTIV